MRTILVILLFSVFLHYSCNPITERLEQYHVHGIDVSHYQSIINWDTLATQDITFTFVKATEGENFSDTLYCHNWKEMNRVGIIRGAYHFFRPKTSIVNQAENFISSVQFEEGDLPPVLDVEVLDGASKLELIVGIREWLNIIETFYKRKAIIYTNVKFYNKYLAGHFDDNIYWIARYNKDAPDLNFGKSWHFWQYGNRGRLKGIEGDVDFNVFNGTREELEMLCFSEEIIVDTPVLQ